MSDVLHRIPAPKEKLSGLSRQQVYGLLKLGLLEGRRFGATTFITDESLRSLPEKLPKYEPDTSDTAARLVEARRRKSPQQRTEA